MVTYTSDHFEDFEGYAKGMIKTGDAYMDDTPQVPLNSNICLSFRPR